MRVKDYKCKCGHDDFFFADKGNQTGIYCSYCGKWLKWADKDEQNLSMKQEPKTGHWRPIYQGDEIIGYRCSECEFGRTKSIYRANYCHNCGAAMREGET